MKKLTDLENFRLNENDLWEDDMDAIEKVALYCDEVIGTDLVIGKQADELQEALNKFKKGALELKDILESLNGADLLPSETDGSLPEPDEVINLIKLR